MRYVIPSLELMNERARSFTGIKEHAGFIFLSECFDPLR